MGILKKISVYLMLSVLAVMLVFPYLLIAGYYLSDTKLEIRNKSGKPVDVTIKLIEIEHDNEESNYKAHLENGERVTCEVKRGVKVMQYNTQYTEGVLDFSVGKGRREKFCIKYNDRLETYFGND